MSKLTGLFRKMRGSVGDVTFRQVAGTTVVSEKSTSPAQPRTYAQMRQRVMWRNLQNIYRALQPYNHPSFEDARGFRRDAQMFMSANLGVIPIYLTRSEAVQGAAVIAPYQITRGSLPAIDVNASGVSGEVGTDISLGNLTIGEETTVAQFSAAVVNNNENFHYGDQISAIVVRQMTNSSTNVPYVAVQAFEVTLSASDTTTLLSDIDPDGLVFAKQGSSDKLGMNQTVNGGVVYIHSRKSASKTLVSTQRFVVANTIMSRYQSDAKLDEAILSYGGKLDNQFLTPDVAPVTA